MNVRKYLNTPQIFITYYNCFSCIFLTNKKYYKIITVIGFENEDALLNGYQEDLRFAAGSGSFSKNKNPVLAAVIFKKDFDNDDNIDVKNAT